MKLYLIWIALFSILGIILQFSFNNCINSQNEIQKQIDEKNLVRTWRVMALQSSVTGFLIEDKVEIIETFSGATTYKYSDLEAKNQGDFFNKEIAKLGGEVSILKIQEEKKANTCRAISYSQFLVFFFISVITLIQVLITKERNLKER